MCRDHGDLSLGLVIHFALEHLGLNMRGVRFGGVSGGKHVSMITTRPQSVFPLFPPCFLSAFRVGMGSFLTHALSPHPAPPLYLLGMEKLNSCVGSG